MPRHKHYGVTVKAVVRKIRDREGFDVCFRYRHNGKKVRMDKELETQYPDWDRKAPDTLTVAGWRGRRFNRVFSNFDVDVLDVEGRAVGGGTKLRSVRATYTDY